MNPYEVTVSEEARRQLGECVLFLARKDVDAAERLRERLIESIRSLAHMPTRFPFFDEPYISKDRYHKMFVEKYYLILYQIRDYHVYVDYVIDCHRDYQWLLH